MQRTLRLAVATTLAALLLAGCGGGGGGGGGGGSGSVVPTDVRVDPASRMINVSWSAVSGATNYNVYVAASPAVSPANYDKLPEGQHAPAVPGTSVRFEGLLEGGTYWVVVSAILDGSEGPASSPTWAVLPVGTVRDLGTSSDVASVRVVWSAARGASSYEVFMSLTPDVSPTSYDRRLTASSNSTEFDGLTNGTTYWFAVRASNVNGSGPLSRAIPGVPSGLGTIGDVTAFQAGEGTTDLVLADVNDDGADEFLVANQTAGTVQTFGRGVDPRDPYVLLGELSVYGDVPTAIGVLDATEDGILDLAVARSGDATVTIHRGYGDGTFEEAAFWTIPVGAKPVDLLVADVNADGYMDVLTADYEGNSVSMALGQTAAPHEEPVYDWVPVYEWVPVYDEWGEYLYDDYQYIGDEWAIVGWVWVTEDPFTPTVKVCEAFGPVALSGGDLDADADIDVLVVESTLHRMLVLTNDGSAAFSVSDQVALPCAPTAVEATDTTGDGVADAILTSQDASCVLLFVNDGTGRFSGGGDLSPSPDPVESITTDMNGDGKLDLVVADIVSGEVTIYLGNGYGGYHEHFQMSPCDSVARVRSSDVDGDGHMDLVVSDPVGGCVLILFGSSV